MEYRNLPRSRNYKSLATIILVHQINATQLHCRYFIDISAIVENY